MDILGLGSFFSGLVNQAGGNAGSILKMLEKKNPANILGNALSAAIDGYQADKKVRAHTMVGAAEAAGAPFSGVNPSRFKSTMPTSFFMQIQTDLKDKNKKNKLIEDYIKKYLTDEAEKFGGEQPGHTLEGPMTKYLRTM